MKTIFIGLFVALVAFSPYSAYPGAISAGGLMASASLECLFANRESPLEPLNFTIFNLGPAVTSAKLEKPNLQAKKPVWAIHYPEFSTRSRASFRFYSAGNEKDDSEVEIKMDSSRPVSEDQARSLFAPLFSIKGTELANDVRKYRGTLNFRGQTYKGVCAEQYFIFYDQGP